MPLIKLHNMRHISRCGPTDTYCLYANGQLYHHGPDGYFGEVESIEILIDKDQLARLLRSIPAHIKPR